MSRSKGYTDGKTVENKLSTQEYNDNEMNGKNMSISNATMLRNVLSSSPTATTVDKTKKKSQPNIDGWVGG